VEAVPIVAGGFPEDVGRVSGSTEAADQGLAWSPVSMVGDHLDFHCRADDHRALSYQDLNFQADDSRHSAVFPVAHQTPVPAPVAYWVAD
jgi:hypothetical protein